MVMEEGPRAFFYGLFPGMCRQMIFLGIGNGLYVPVRDAIILKSSSKKQTTSANAPNATLTQKIVAGLISASVGVTIGNPFEVVKVRL